MREVEKMGNPFGHQPEEKIDRKENQETPIGLSKEGEENIQKLLEYDYFRQRIPDSEFDDMGFAAAMTWNQIEKGMLKNLSSEDQSHVIKAVGIIRNDPRYHEYLYQELPERRSEPRPEDQEMVA